MSTESTQKASQGARELAQTVLGDFSFINKESAAVRIDRELGELLEAARNAANDSQEDYSLGRFELREVLKKWNTK